MKTFVLKIVLAIPIISAFILAPIYLPASVYADSKSALTQGATDVSGQTGNPNTSINTSLTKFINILSLIGGVIAVVFLIIGGYKYITSGGDANKISSAKNTILYALIGLIIVVLSQVIVRFVLKQSTGTGP